MTLGTFARGYPANHEKSERRPELGAPPLYLCRGWRHTVVRLFVMPRAELLRHTVIVLSVRLSQAFLVARWKLSAETSNTSWYRCLLGSDRKKFGSKASFVSYGVIYLSWLPWLAIWTLLKTKPPILDFLEARRFDLYYRIAWRVQRNRAKKLWHGQSPSHSRTGTAVTPSWLASAWLLCLHINYLAVALAKFTVCSVFRATYVCQVANISPRHQHLWCYFYAEGGGIR